MMKRAFTLIEVNLAVMIMAGGILSVVVLYSLGFRESRQSREDIASAAYADAVISPLVAALSQTNITWQTFKELDSYPSKDGWGSYLNDDGTVRSNPGGLAMSAFNSVMTAIKKDSGVKTFSYPNDTKGGLDNAGLIVIHEEDSSLVRIGFRASDRRSTLLTSPLYYSEVRFQGVQE